MTRVWVLSDERYLGQRMPSALLQELARRGVPTRTVVADRLVQPLGAGAALPDAWDGLVAGDVVLARTRNRTGLALLRAVERPGVRLVTAPGPIDAVRDKPRAAQVLARCGVPTPPTYLADGPALLRALPADRFPLLLKPHAGDNARGIVLARTPDDLDELDWTDSMVLAQEYVETGAVDLKVYVVGTTVWAVRRPSPLSLPGRPAPRVAELVPVTAEVRELALTCGRAFDLPLYGLDVLESDAGPVVVDVNEFPNYTGIDEAPAAVADLVLARADRPVAA